jgi:hypothetical protein
MLSRNAWFLISASVALMAFAEGAQAQPILQIFTSVGPNPTIPTPGFIGTTPPIPTGVGGGGYAVFATPPGTVQGNALTGLISNGSNLVFPTNNAINVGDPTATPGAYTNLSGTPGGFVQIAPQAFLSSPQFSWAGQLNPGTVFGPAFANEQGNFVFFGLRIDGTATNFNLANLTLDLTSNSQSYIPGTLTIPSAAIFPQGYDTPGLRAFDAAGNLLTGAFPAPGQEDVAIAYFTGVGLSNGNATIADALNEILTQMTVNDGLQITGTYNLTFGQGGLASASATFEIVPEPTSLALWAGLAGAFGAFRLSRRRLSVGLVS